MNVQETVVPGAAVASGAVYFTARDVVSRKDVLAAYHHATSHPDAAVLRDVPKDRRAETN